MLLSRQFSFVVAAFLLTLPALGQDPFATPKRAQDPFGSPRPVQDPFGGRSAANDPFAAPPTQGRPSVAAALIASDAQSDQDARQLGLSAEQFIIAELAQPVTQAFVEEPLESALRVLMDQFDMPYVIDTMALEQLGLAPDTAISVNLKNVRLRSFLNIMLGAIDCTYVIKNDALIITSNERATEMPVLRSYALPQPLGEKSEKVLNALITTVTPELWDASGGPAHAAIVEHVLVVSGTEQVHESVVEFIAQLQAAFKRSTQP